MAQIGFESHKLKNAKKKKNAKGHNYVNILWNLPKVYQFIFTSKTVYQISMP